MHINEENSLLRTVTTVKKNSVNAYRAKLCLYDGRTLFAAGIAYVTLILNVLEPGRCNSICFRLRTVLCYKNSVRLQYVKSVFPIFRIWTVLYVSELQIPRAFCSSRSTWFYQPIPL